MEIIDIFRFVASFLFVIGLIVFCAWMAKRWDLFSQSRFGPNNKRLGLVETLHIDGKRKLVIVKRDGVQHTLLLGPTSDLVVEQSIEAPADVSISEPSLAPNNGDPRTMQPPSQDVHHKIARIK